MSIRRAAAPTSWRAANLGEMPALIAAAALMIDYVLTVAVSVAAGVAAITSAVPEWFGHRTALGLLFTLFIVVVNLRGVRESGKFFAVPTYLAIGGLGLMVLAGTYSIPLERQHRASSGHSNRAD